MKYEVAQKLIEEAARDIDQAEATVGQALATDNAAVWAAIAQAKLLAVIASVLTEMKETQSALAQL